MRMRIQAVALSLAVVLAGAASVRAVDQPQVVDGALVYPEGAEIPRYMTEVERAWLDQHGYPPRLRAATPAPIGPVHCVAEYEPMEGVLIAWESFTTLLTQMTQRLTTTGSIVYVVVDTVSEQTTASSTLSGGGANMANVRFVVRGTDTVWIRDYGPRYLYQGQCRVVVDHTYNRPRPNDDTLPSFFAGSKKHGFYEYQNLFGNLQLIHGGGNYHLDAAGRAFATRLTVNENPTLTEPQIVTIWNTYQNVNHTFFNPFPTSVDSTQHIDMWIQICGDNRIVISDWPNNPGSTQDNICDSAATYFSGIGYSVFRVPAFSISGVHYTYTNVVICNNLVLVPLYTNASVSPSNATALAAWQAAMPGYNVQQLNCDAIVPSAGVMHCIVMHVPVHLGGANPTVYLKNLRGGEVLTPGSNVGIEWISDDDVGTVNADILFSTDGGATYPTTIASATADDGQFTWTVPNVCTSRARIRVVARDAGNNTGFDSSPANFRIAAVPCPGDMNCDGLVDLNDVGPMALALVDPIGYAAAYPSCNIINGDLNGDMFENGADVQGFVAALVGP